MRRLHLAGLPLRLRIAAGRIHPFTLGAAAILAMLAGGLAWTGHATWLLDQERLRAAASRRALAAAPAPSPASAPMSPAVRDAAALARFTAMLAPSGAMDEQVRTLFRLAAQHGLTLRQGEYKAVADRAAHLTAYHIELPVHGGYGAVWGFALGALRAMPYAALDDVGFRRDEVGDPAVEARLRFTLYLAEGVPAAGGMP
jgi:hypothetical protein